MAHPKTLLREHFDTLGRTVSTVRSGMHVAVAAYCRTGPSVKASALGDAPGMTTEPGEPAEVRAQAIRACLSEAFPAASRVGTELVQVERGEEAALCCLLCGLGPDTSPDEFQHWARENLGRLRRAVTEIVSHSSRFADTRTGQHWVDTTPEQGEPEPYLSSRTVKSPLHHAYCGNSNIAPVARVLAAPFVYDGCRTTLYLELKKGNSHFLAAAGMPIDVLEPLVAELDAPTSFHARVTQVAWPVGSGYHALTPLPSVAVLDELSWQHDFNTLAQALPGDFLPTLEMAVGGTNPQNAGAFNAATGGAYHLYRSELVTHQHAPAQQLRRRMWTPDWLVAPPRSLVAALGRDLSRLPGPAIDRYMAKLVPDMVDLAFSFGRQAVDAVDQGVVEVDSALQEHLELIPLWRFLTDPSSQTAEPLAEAVMELCSEASAGGASPELQRRFRRALDVALQQLAQGGRPWG